MTVGQGAIDLSKMTKESVEKSLESLIFRVYGQELEVESFSLPRWSTDPNYCGCYTNTPILSEHENLESFYRNLSEPLNDETFHFAGEAYDYVNAGFMQGAYKSALRTVKTLKSKFTENNF